MAQAKKKTATKTAKKACKNQAHKKACAKSTRCKSVSKQEKMHIYAIAGMSIIAGVLLFANAVMMIV